MKSGVASGSDLSLTTRVFTGTGYPTDYADFTESIRAPSRLPKKQNEVTAGYFKSLLESVKSA